MKTATFDSQELPAFSEAYLRHARNESATSSVAAICSPIELNGSVLSAPSQSVDHSHSANVRKVLAELTALWMRTSSNSKNARIFCDAFEFVGAMPRSIPRPCVWADDGEVVFEWITGDRHAVVSCEGDGVIGYTYKKDGIFVPGDQSLIPPTEFPADLNAYLA